MKNHQQYGATRLVLIAVAGIAVVGATVAWMWPGNDRGQSTQAESTSPAASAGAIATTSSTSSTASARLGPGMWTADVTGASSSANPGGGAWLQPPQAAHVSADGKLVIDRALHQVCDYFLLGGLPGDRATHTRQLRAYFDRTLPATASKDASQVVDRYLLYMNMHDDLLARQALPQWVDLPTPAEAERITNWVRQRTRLRETVLGADLAQAWFADEEAAIKAGIAEFEQHDEQAPTGRASRMQEAGREARREQFLRQLAEEGSRSYAVIEHERQLSAARAANSAS